MLNPDSTLYLYFLFQFGWFVLVLQSWCPKYKLFYRWMLLRVCHRVWDPMLSVLHLPCVLSILCFLTFFFGIFFDQFSLFFFGFIFIFFYRSVQFHPPQSRPFIYRSDRKSV